MNYHAHLVKSTLFNATKNICKHTREIKYIVITTKNLKMTMKLILKQAYLGLVIKTLHQNLKVTCCLCKNKKLVPNIS